MVACQWLKTISEMVPKNGASMRDGVQIFGHFLHNRYTTSGAMHSRGNPFLLDVYLQDNAHLILVERILCNLYILIERNLQCNHPNAISVMRIIRSAPAGFPGDREADANHTCPTS